MRHCTASQHKLATMHAHDPRQMPRIRIYLSVSLFLSPPLFLFCAFMVTNFTGACSSQSLTNSTSPVHPPDFPRRNARASPHGLLLRLPGSGEAREARPGSSGGSDRSGDRGAGGAAAAAASGGPAARGQRALCARLHRAWREPRDRAQAAGGCGSGRTGREVPYGTYVIVLEWIACELNR